MGEDPHMHGWEEHARHMQEGHRREEHEGHG